MQYSEAVQFCVDSEILGTDKNLIVSDDGYSWVSFVPKDTWHYTGAIKINNDRCLDSLMKLEGFSLDSLPPKKFVTSMTSLMSGSVVPWQKVMPKREHHAFTKNVIDSLKGFTNTVPTNYYDGTWVPGNVAMRSLVPAKINIDLWNQIMNSNAGNKHIVATFKPDESGYAPLTTYDRFGTLTGRSTVFSGSNILTLKKEFRSIITSSFQGGKVFMIDFAALEARVLLYEAGKRCDDVDLYNMISSDIGVDRDAVKLAVICELYGGSRYMLGKKLNMEGKELSRFFNRIKDYFDTETLLKRVKKQFIDTGVLINRYDRKVLVDEPLDHVMINYYAQSSGADVTLLGFSSIVDHLKSYGVRPLYLLYDAMFVDCPPSSFNEVTSLRTVKVKGYVQPYFLKVTELGCTLPHSALSSEHELDT